MSFKNNIICEEFSKEMWKFLDGSLSDDEKAFWEKHLDSCSFCRAILNETEKGLSVYESLPLEDISEEKFEVMIQKAVNKSRLAARISSHFKFKIKNESHLSFAFNRIALSTAALAAVVVMFFIYRPRHEKYQNQTAETLSQKDKEIYSNQADSNIKFENNIELTIKTPAVRIRHEVIEWKAQVVRDKINEVGYSLDQIDQNEERRLRYVDKWSMKAAALGQEIERLEREINNSSL